MLPLGKTKEKHLCGTGFKRKEYFCLYVESYLQDDSKFVEVLRNTNDRVYGQIPLILCNIIDFSNIQLNLL
jgi:hypothetical protein